MEQKAHPRGYPVYKHLIVLTLGLALAGASPAAASTYPYTMTDLGSLGYNTYGLAINAIGQITGYSYTTAEVQIPCPKSPDYPPQKKCFENPYHAFLWSNGTMKDLGTLGGNFG
jgi:uncharacterized membrane protein